MRALNDDQYIIADLDQPIATRQASVPADECAHWSSKVQGKFLAVADGFSGVGEVASMATIDRVLHYITSAMPWVFELDGPDDGDSKEQILENLQHMLIRCEHRLRRIAEKRGEPSISGAITLAYLVWPDLYVVHAGDGLCYLLRDGELHRIPAGNPGQSSLTTFSRVTHSGASDERVATGDHGGSGMHHVVLRKGDRILLCTSSLARYVDEDEMADHLGLDLPSSTVCDHLIATAKQAGGADNITAVVCRCD